MKKLIILIVSAAALILASPTFAGDKKKSRSAGAKSDRSSQHQSSRNTDRNRASGNKQSSQRSGDRNRSRDSSRSNSNGDKKNHARGNQRQGQRLASRHGNNNYQERHTSRNRRHSNRHYGYGYANNYNYRYSNYYRHHNNSYNYLLGGVVLGSLLHNSHHLHTRHCGHDYDYPRYSRTVVTRVVREGTYASRDDVHLFRDQYGDCYEVTQNRHGDEIHEEIAPEYCEW